MHHNPSVKSSTSSFTKIKCSSTCLVFSNISNRCKMRAFWMCRKQTMGKKQTGKQNTIRKRRINVSLCSAHHLDFLAKGNFTHTVLLQHEVTLTVWPHSIQIFPLYLHLIYSDRLQLEHVKYSACLEP